jgi:hypothetical protein
MELTSVKTMSKALKIDLSPMYPAPLSNKLTHHQENGNKMADCTTTRASHNNQGCLFNSNCSSNLSCFFTIQL